jgi:hypothetical protein
MKLIMISLLRMMMDLHTLLISTLTVTVQFTTVGLKMLMTGAFMKKNPPTTHTLTLPTMNSKTDTTSSTATTLWKLNHAKSTTLTTMKLVSSTTDTHGNITWTHMESQNSDLSITQSVLKKTLNMVSIKNITNSIAQTMKLFTDKILLDVTMTTTKL